MRRAWGLLGITMALLGSPAVAVVTHELPFDPNICVAPVESADPGAPPYATIPSHDRPQFIPGHPTPIFHGEWTASYLDAGGRLRRHPGGGPHFLDAFFLGSDGDVYWWPWSRSDQRLVFDRDLGYFRPLELAEAARHRQVEGFLAEIAAAPRREDAPSHIYWGGVFPTRQRQAIQDADEPGYGTQRKWAERPHFGLRIEIEDNTLRLSWGDRTRELTLPRVGHGNWYLTELQKSEQVLYQGDVGFFLIDRDLNLTRPEGVWRLNLPREVFYLPETGEALITTIAAPRNWDGLFWLRDRRISGQDICADTAPPPAREGFRRVPFAGIEVIDTERMSNVWPVWTGQSLLVAGTNGAFEIPLEGPVRRLEAVPSTGWTGVMRVPMSDLIVIATCDRLFLHDGKQITYSSGALTGC